MNIPSQSNRDVTVIVRSVRERTTDTCLALLAGQVPADQLFVVEARPFSESLRQSFELGMAQKRRWTLCVDADVLPASNAVEVLLREADILPVRFAELEGLIIDKLFGGARAAGNHLYRTALLPLAMEQLGEAADQVRPEAFTIARLQKRGHPWKLIPQVFGLHDFEQSHRDLFRKCYVHAHKHEEWLHHLVRYWRRMARQDDDFDAALRGLAAGIAYRGQVKVDADDAWMNQCWQTLGDGCENKPDLKAGALSAVEVDRLVAAFQEAPEFREMFPQAFDLLRKQSRLGRFRQARARLGFVGALRWMAGDSLMTLGRMLREAASKRTSRKTLDRS